VITLSADKVSDEPVLRQQKCRLGDKSLTNSILRLFFKFPPRTCSSSTVDENRRKTTRKLGSGFLEVVITNLSPPDGKPAIPVQGLRATWGSKLYADFVPSVDELPIARLRAGGAVILGKTNCPEFTLQGYTDNLLFGPSRNPWNLTLTPGGSSGGAVAAVCAGLGPVAIGTDGGGSIRRPASHTGLVGLKPSRGRVPRADGFPAMLLDFEVIGPMTRTVADLVNAMRLLSAPDRLDPLSTAFSDRPFEIPSAPATRILYVPHFGSSPVDPEILTSVN
jgi:aspartyl-tRNA(Asn)/glutamyl-tRNA(Gln) amidotransferase subunit A